MTTQFQSFCHGQEHLPRAQAAHLCKVVLVTHQCFDFCWIVISFSLALSPPACCLGWARNGAGTVPGQLSWPGQRDISCQITLWSEKDCAELLVLRNCLGTVLLMGGGKLLPLCHFIPSFHLLNHLSSWPMSFIGFCTCFSSTVPLGWDSSVGWRALTALTTTNGDVL